MNKEHFLLAPAERPDWLEYPRSFIRIVDQQLVHITPWHVMNAEDALKRFRGISTRYPSRRLFPFAYRQDNDDLACWEMDKGERVILIHDFASPGDEERAQYEDVWHWFRAAVEDTIDWD